MRDGVDDGSDVGHLQHVRERHLAGLGVDFDFDCKRGEVGVADVISVLGIRYVRPLHFDRLPPPDAGGDVLKWK